MKTFSFSYTLVFLIMSLSYVRGAGAEAHDEWIRIDKTELYLKVTLKVNKLQEGQLVSLLCEIRNAGAESALIVTGRKNAGEFVPHLILRNQNQRFMVTPPRVQPTELLFAGDSAETQTIAPKETLEYHRSVFSVPLDLTQYELRIQLGGPSERDPFVPRDIKEAYPKALFFGGFETPPIKAD